MTDKKDDTTNGADDKADKTDKKAAPDLDAILAEIEAEDEAKAKGKDDDDDADKGKGKTGDDKDEKYSRLERELDALKTKETSREVSAKVKESIQYVLEANPELKEHMDEDDIEAHLRLRAERNQKIMTAFARSGSDPKTWSKVLDGIAADLGKKVAKKSKGATDEERAAAEAAARGVTNRRPRDDKDKPTVSQINSMSAAEYRALQQKTYGTSRSPDGL